MKTVISKWAVILLFGALPWSPLLAQERVATVDLNKLFEGYWKTKNARIIIDSHKADLTKQGNSLVEDLKTANEDYNKLLAAANDQALSTEKRDERKLKAEAKLREIEESKETVSQFTRRAESQLRDEFMRTRESILKEILAAVVAKAKSAAYDVVVDTAAESAQGTPIVVFSNGKEDLTDAVLSQLNLGAPPEMPRPVSSNADFLLSPTDNKNAK